MDLPFNSPEFGQAWEEWIEWRKQNKWPKYVPKGLVKTFAHLVNISGNDEKTAISIIDQSIAQGYRGLFRLKNERPNQSNQQLGTSAARMEAAKNW